MSQQPEAIAHCLKTKNKFKIAATSNAVGIFATHESLKQSVRNEMKRPRNERYLTNFTGFEP